MLLQKMAEEFGGCVTVQMLYHAATDAFFVKMLIAVTSLAHVLKHVAEVVRIAEFLHAVIVAELIQLTVDTAFSSFFIAVEGFAKLLGAKLLVGVRGEKADQRGSPRSVVGFLLHRGSFFKFENDSQIIA